MSKPQPSKDHFWTEMAALLIPETPGPEWFTVKQLSEMWGRKNSGGFSTRLNKNKKLEKRQFTIKGKITNYYRVKK